MTGVQTCALPIYLDEWLSTSGLSADPTAPLFPTMRHGKLTDHLPLAQANAHMMIQRRAVSAATLNCGVVMVLMVAWRLIL